MPMADRPIIFSAPMIRALLDGRKTQTRRLAWRDPLAGGPGDGLEQRPSPWQRVQPGDRLWVREAWSPHPDGVMAHGAVYRLGHEEEAKAGPGIERWRSPIHMPRWASRLTLTVTDVRVQRVHDMLLNDYEAEGVVDRPMSTDEGIRAFSTLWDGLHGPGAWDANPHVVALTFTVEQRNIDAA
jgi:hypothetical protein